HAQSDGANACAARRDARRRASAAGADRQVRSCWRKSAVRVGFDPLGFAVPTPARDEDGVDAFTPLQLADRDAGQLGITPPFALAGDDKIEVELAYQAHAMG